MPFENPRKKCNYRSSRLRSKRTYRRDSWSQGADKDFIKNGFNYDPSDSRGGISSTSVKVKPINPDSIRRNTGALGANYYVDIDVSNMSVFLKGITKGGVADFKIQDNVSIKNIINSGRVQK